jgi:uncharacterized repeat protein (TIGR03803 family)
MASTPANTENLLWQLSGAPTDGAQPYSGVIADMGGNLYGTTQAGGQNPMPAFGTVYELTPSGSSWNEKVLQTFHGANGYYPYASVIFDGSGNLYGTTLAGGSTYGSGCNAVGCGAVFELTSVGSSWTESVLYNFTDGTDGGEPYGPVTFDKSGKNLYGTTEFGGSASCSPSSPGCGVVFELTASSHGWKETVLHAFGGSDGKFPSTRLLVDAHGNVFGTTAKGGSGCGSLGCGVAFELTGHGSSWKETVIHAFTNGTDGGAPSSGLLADTKGALYGATSSGGNHGSGVVYKLTHSGANWKQQVLFAFDAGTSTAIAPYGELAFDTHGDLFGAAGGGSDCTIGHQRFSCGVVYRLTPKKKGMWSEANLFEFSKGLGGWFPNGGLLVNTAGDVFGTTQRSTKDAAGCCGVVYELIP